MSNPHWELVNGRAKRKRRFPESVRAEKTEVRGLTLDIITTRSLTFTVEQLRYACTVDKMVGVPMSREQSQDLFKEVARQNRWVLFESFEPYSITFNGYGQLKSMELKDGSRRLGVDEIFNRLDKEFLTL